MKRKIKHIVNEVVSKLIKKINLRKLFDFSKIPDEELRRQHYDISLIHARSGYGSLLMKNKKGDYITENDSRVTPASQVKHEIDFKYGFAPWQFRVIERGHDIQICLCIANFPNAVKEITKDLNQMGYFISSEEIVIDHLNQEWYEMQFEPIYQVDESDEILNLGDLYHITPSYNVEGILANGLMPSSKNSKFKYPNRIFLMTGNIPIDSIKSIGKQLYNNDTNNNNDGTYTLFKIDSEQLRGNISLYYDPNFEFGAFTEQLIPPQAITIVVTIKYKNKD